MRHRYRVIVQAQWVGGSHDAGADCLLALHTRRSYEAIRDWRQRSVDKPVIVALTGTDLYRDLPENAQARTSLEAADRLIVLQEYALRFLPAEHRTKARVIYQSARALRPYQKAHERLSCILVGHLRAEKDPLTAVRAWDYLERGEPIHLLHVGAALDRQLGRAAESHQSREPRYRWIGPRPHAWTRQAIKRAHLLIPPSKMEGGTNVIAEAITAGTPVVASRTSGNIGMLGSAYRGYFDVGDAEGLAHLVMRCWQDPKIYRELMRQCQARKALFRPELKRTALVRLIDELV